MSDSLRVDQAAYQPYTKFIKIKESLLPSTDHQIEYCLTHPNAQHESSNLRENRNLERLPHHEVEHEAELQISPADLQEMVANIDKEIKFRKCAHVVTKTKTVIYKCMPQITLCVGGSIAINSILLCIKAADPFLYLPTSIIDVAMTIATYKATKNESRVASEESSDSSLKEEEILNSFTRTSDKKLEKLDNIKESFTEKLAEVQGLTIQELNEQVKKTQKSIWFNRFKSWGCSFITWALPASALINIINQIWSITTSEGIDPALIYYAIISLGINGFWSIFATIYSNKFWAKKKESYKENITTLKEEHDLISEQFIKQFEQIELKIVPREEEIAEEITINTLDERLLQR